MNIEKYRDLTLIDINENQRLVISCDSSGSIGEKEHDIVKSPPGIVGYFSTQVAIIELIAFGAKPITVVNTLSVEMDSTGKKILAGIKNALKPLNLDNDVIITGSTEENFPTSVTGMGITVIGILDKKDWKKPETKSGMIAAVIGIPKLGNEVLEDKGEIMSISRIIELKKKDYIGEILPVGSKGILYELGEMAKSNNLNFALKDNVNINLKKSAGPSTCVIVSIEESEYEKLKTETDLKVSKIARFKNK